MKNEHMINIAINTDDGDSSCVHAPSNMNMRNVKALFLKNTGLKAENILDLCKVPDCDMSFYCFDNEFWI